MLTDIGLALRTVPFHIVLLPFISGWIVSSLSLWLAGRVVVGKRASLLGAFLITLIGPLIVGFSLLFTATFLGPILGALIALFVWLGLVKAIFQTGWLAAIGISILSIFMLMVVTLMVAGLLGIALLAF